MDILITRQLPGEILSVFPADYQLRMHSSADNPIGRKELLEQVQGVDGILCLLTEQIDVEILQQAGDSLRVVANMAVGYDNIDIQQAAMRNIIVTNTPDVLTETTADFVFGLLLATARRIPEAERYLKSGQWKTWSPMLLTGLDVYGQTIGIIGMGRIGQAVARRAVGFGMRVVYTSKTRKPDIEQTLPCTYLSLHDLCQTADFVVPLAPRSPSTHHLIGAVEFSLMKKTAVLVNASRGSVIDEDALIEALITRKIWAAGLDVFHTEPISATSPLLQLENVVLAPHIGSASVQTRIHMGQVAARNIVQVLSGERPSNPVHVI